MRQPLIGFFSLYKNDVDLILILPVSLSGPAGSADKNTVSFYGEGSGGILKIYFPKTESKAKVMIFREISLIKVKFSLILILLKELNAIFNPPGMQNYK